MYKLLIDTNILLDALMPGRPFRTEALEVIKRCSGFESDGDLGLVSPMSLKDSYYILRREYDEPRARQAIACLMGMLPIAPISGEECDLAVTSNEPDFEDGLMRAIAELNDIDFIITRDAKAFTRSKVRSVSAAEYLEIAQPHERGVPFCAP